MSITPDGKSIYQPSFEKDHWFVMEGATGEIIKKIVPKSGAHNTVCSPDGTRAYLAGLRSPYLLVMNAKTHEEVGKVGPFSAAIRPFTVDGSNSKCYVNVNGLLGPGGRRHQGRQEALPCRSGVGSSRGPHQAATAAPATASA